MEHQQVGCGFSDMTEQARMEFFYLVIVPGVITLMVGIYELRKKYLEKGEVTVSDITSLFLLCIIPVINIFCLVIYALVVIDEKIGWIFNAIANKAIFKRKSDLTRITHNPDCEKCLNKRR